MSTFPSGDEIYYCLHGDDNFLDSDNLTPDEVLFVQCTQVDSWAERSRRKVRRWQLTPPQNVPAWLYPCPTFLLGVPSLGAAMA